MATLSDVNLSTQPEKVQEHLQEAEREQTLIATKAAVQPESDYVIYKLVDNKRNGALNIDGCDDVVNPKTGKTERIWLIAGAQSIWSSDLTELLKDKDYVRQNRRSLKFEGKILRIPKWDDRAIEFASVCRHNIGNPHRKTGSKFEFFEYDPQKQQKEALDKELLEIEMAIQASNQPEDLMRKHASFLGIQPIDELGRPKTSDGIRKEYILAAKRNPVLFKNTVGSKEVEIAYMVKAAILDAKIDLGKHNGTAYFANGGVIAKIPANRKPLEYLIEFAMTNSNEGKEFLENLKKIS